MKFKLLVGRTASKQCNLALQKQTILTSYPKMLAIIKFSIASLTRMLDDLPYIYCINFRNEKLGQNFKPQGSETHPEIGLVSISANLCCKCLRT